MIGTGTPAKYPVFSRFVETRRGALRCPERIMTEITTESGLRYEDIETGSGTLCTGRGQTAIVHYTGWLEDGTRFDSSKDRGDPFSFPIDCGYVIRGWDEGVQGMKVGGKRKLIIPAELAYGSSGAGGVIPPDATLTFEIELLELSE